MKHYCLHEIDVSHRSHRVINRVTDLIGRGIYDDDRMSRDKIRNRHLNPDRTRMRHFVLTGSLAHIVAAAGLDFSPAQQSQTWSANTRVATLDYIVVAKDHQGNGIGKDLLERLEHIAQVEGADVISVFSKESATGFYAHMDYHRIVHTLGDTTMLCFEKQLATAR